MLSDADDQAADAVSYWNSTDFNRSNRIETPNYSQAVGWSVEILNYMYEFLTSWFYMANKRDKGWTFQVFQEQETDAASLYRSILTVSKACTRACQSNLANIQMKTFNNSNYAERWITKWMWM